MRDGLIFIGLVSLCIGGIASSFYMATNAKNEERILLRFENPYNKDVKLCVQCESGTAKCIVLRENNTTGMTLPASIRDCVFTPKVEWF